MVLMDSSFGMRNLRNLNPRACEEQNAAAPLQLTQPMTEETFRGASLQAPFALNTLPLLCVLIQPRVERTSTEGWVSVELF